MGLIRTWLVTETGKLRLPIGQLSDLTNKQLEFSSLIHQQSAFVSAPTLRKLYFHCLTHWMGYNRGDSFPFDFEPNGNIFGSKSKGKLSPQSYPIQCEGKWKYNFFQCTRLHNLIFLGRYDRITVRVNYCSRECA